MTPALFALLATLIAGIGARDQILVAGLVARLGRAPALFVVAVGAAVLTSALAAWGAAAFATMLPTRPARLMVAAMALVMAGGESLLIGPRPAPREPTRSLGAAALVLLAMQASDAARFLVLAIAEASAAPIPAAAGGAAGTVLAMALAFAEGRWLLASMRALRWLRRLAGLALMAAGVGFGLWVRLYVHAD